MVFLKKRSRKYSTHCLQQNPVEQGLAWQYAMKLFKNITGLSIVKSQEGIGTKMFIRLPLDGDDAGAV